MKKCLQNFKNRNEIHDFHKKNHQNLDFVLGRWKCVGVVVEGDAGAKDNVGFLIPVQVVRHFLIDIKRRMMDPSHPMGFPGAGGLSLQSAEKKSTRTMFAIPDAYPGQGLVVMSECPTGSTFDGVLKKFDVLLEVDGHAITTTGMYQPRYEDEGLTEEVGEKSDEENFRSFRQMIKIASKKYFFTQKSLKSRTILLIFVLGAHELAFRQASLWRHHNRQGHPRRGRGVAG